MSKKNTTNESVLRDFAGGIISLYLIVMFTFYPLYMSEGFYYLDQYKFRMLRLISVTAFIFCLSNVEIREDISHIYNNGKDYNNCGFSVRIPYYSIADKTNYDIYAQYELNDANSVLVSMDGFISNGAGEIKDEE